MAKDASKAVDIRAKTPDELTHMLLDLRKEQFNMRFQRATGQQEGTARIGVVRREIARVKTILGEKQRSAMGGKQHATTASGAAASARVS